MQQSNTKYFRYGSRPIFHISGNWGVAVTVDRFLNEGVRVFSLIFMIRFMEVNVICHFWNCRFYFQKLVCNILFSAGNFIDVWIDFILCKRESGSILCHRKNIRYSNKQKQICSFHQIVYVPNLTRTLKCISITLINNSKNWKSW